MSKFLIFIAVFITGCSYFQKGTLSVLVENNGKPLENNQIYLYSIDEKFKQEKFITQHLSNKNGMMKWNFNYSNVKNIKIVVQNNSIEKIYLPEVVFLKSPGWWQDHDVLLRVNLKELDLKSIKKAELQKNQINLTKENESLIDYPEDPISQTVSISQIETPL